MPAATVIRLAGGPGLPVPGAYLRAGGFALRADRMWPGFSPVPVDPSRDVVMDVSVSPHRIDARSSAHDASATRTVARGWLLDAERAIDCIATSDGTAFACAELGGVSVSRDGSRVALQAATPDDVAMEWLLGVGLVHAFARRGRFVLHGCAGRWQGRAMACIGDSGAGKSTLARAMARRHGWQRLADDVVPLASAAPPCIAPRFPQLKLDPAAWYPDDGVAEMPLAAIVVLSPRGEASPAVALPAAAARRALIAHTAGARLFDTTLHAAHLDTMTALASHLPVLALTVDERPHDADGAADEALAALESWCRDA